MAEPIYDVSSKWLLEHHGRGVTLLGGMREVISCQALPAEVVQPRQLPDGLLQVRLRGRRDPVLLLVEFCTYPEKRAVKQMMDDLRLVQQVRGVLPDGLALVLRPKGKYMIPEEGTVESALSWSKETLRWKVMPLWTMSAEEMLAQPDVGVVPWVSLMAFSGSPQTLLRRCRERIDREGGALRSNLLAVAQNLIRLRFPGQEFLDLFGGSQAMIESPLMKEFAEKIKHQTWREAIEDMIKGRFGTLSDSARATLEGLNDQAELRGLLLFAGLCKTKEEFLERLAQDATAAPAPTSSRRPRKR